MDEPQAFAEYRWLQLRTNTRHLARPGHAYALCGACPVQVFAVPRCGTSSTYRAGAISQLPGASVRGPSLQAPIPTQEIRLGRDASPVQCFGEAGQEWQAPTPDSHQCRRCLKLETQGTRREGYRGPRLSESRTDLDQFTTATTPQGQKQ